MLLPWMPSVILNFHGVGPVPRKLSGGEGNCWLDQSLFESVLDLAQGQANVQLTFDDGNVSDVELVLPALLQRGLSATFFVCAARLDQSAFLRRDHVRALQANGMRIGSHGANHISWRHLSASGLADELEGSRRILQQICGTPVDTAACPFGAYDRTVLKGLRRTGYRGVYTSDGGSCRAGAWLQPRTTITRSMTLADVQRLVQRGPGTWKQASIHIRSFLKRLR